MGWLWLGLIGIAAFALLRLNGMSRAFGTLAGSALLVGAAGYALQNNASLPASPASADVRRIEVDPGLVAFRSAIMPMGPDESSKFAAADDRLRSGDTTGAAQIMLDAVVRRPGDAALWTGLGSVLSAHDGGQLSPAAKHAFRRAIQLAPNAPGPPFFLGLAQVQSGDPVAAKRAWLQSLALSPREAPYRILIAQRLVMIDQLIAMQSAEAAAR